MTSSETFHIGFGIPAFGVPVTRQPEKMHSGIDWVNCDHSCGDVGKASQVIDRVATHHPGLPRTADKADELLRNRRNSGEIYGV